MKLKFKSLDLVAGKPIAFINKEFAKEYRILEGSRIEVSHKRKKMILPVNIVKKLLEKNEISLSNEATNYLKVKKNELLFISPPLETGSSRLILKKLNKQELNRKEIYTIIQDIVNNALNEAEIAYFVSGVYNNGMTFRETTYMTEAMSHTGRLLHWGNKKVGDKHSIGGVAGNRTTPIVVAICAVAGIIMPKTSSRAITSASGTADVIETITNVNLSTGKLKEVVNKTNACLAWGGSLGLAPADDKIIRVERLLNVDPEPQLLASIISKKISAGSTHILIDIPYGESAKVSMEEAKRLKRKFTELGKHFNLNIQVVLTPGFQPIGNGVGPVLEMLDVLHVLERKNPPRDLEEKAIFLASELLEMMSRAKKGEGKKLAQSILDSKKALDKFNEIVKAQGRKNSDLRPAKFSKDLNSHEDGKIKSIDNKKINTAARILGCPHNIAAGIYLHKHVGEEVKKGEKILTLYSESEKKLEEGLKFCKNSIPVRV